MCSILNALIILSTICLSNIISAEIGFSSNDLPKIIPLILPPAFPDLIDRYGPGTKEFTVFQNISLLILKKNYTLNVVLGCDAPYPVTWTRRSLEHRWVIYKIAERKVINISDSNTYVYSSVLLLRRRSILSDNSDANHVGNFECKSIAYNTSSGASPLKSTILIVFERDPKIRRSNYYFQNILWRNASLEPVLIPCYTTNINEDSVELYAKENRTLRLLKSAEIERIEPFVGYYLNPSAIAWTTDEFICLIKLNTAEVTPNEDLEVNNLINSFSRDTAPNKTMIYFTVTKSEFTTNFNITPSFRILPSTNEYECCRSGTTTTPFGFVIVTLLCIDQMCLTSKAILQSGVVLHNPNKSPSQCIRATRAGKFNVTFNPRIVACADRESGFASQSQEVVGNPQLSLSFDLPHSQELVAGSVITLICSAHSFYFAKGLFWEIHWTNKSIETISGNPFRTNNFYDNKVRNNFTLSEGMEKIGCKAPIWNTAEWVTTTRDITVLDLIPPLRPNSMDNHIVQNVSFYAGQPIELDCEFEGRPKPTYTWKVFPDKIFYPYVMYYSRPTRGFPNAFNYFPSVRNVTAGVLNYNKTEFICTCTASNTGGNATKTFFLKALESKPLVRNGPKTEVAVLYVGRENQNLSCGISDGAPPPQFLWMKFDANLTQNTEMDILNVGNVSYLIFKNIKPADQGEYHCNMSNFRGTTNKRFVVEVRELAESKLWLEVLVIVMFVTIVGLGVWLFYNNRRNEKRIKNLLLTVEYNKTINPAQSSATISTLVG